MWAGPKRQEKILGGLDPAILNGFWNQSPSALALDARIGEFVGLISSYGQSSRQTHSANTESAIPTSAKPSCYSACVEEAVHPGIINELHPLPMAVYCNQLHTGTLVELTAYIRMADESADASGWVAAYHYSEEGRGRFIHEYVLLHVGLRCTAIRTSSYEQGQLRENLQRFELDQDYGTLVPVGDERPEGTFMLPLRQIIAFEQITRGVDFQWLYGSNYSGRQELKDNANLVVGDMNGFAHRAVRHELHRSAVRRLVEPKPLSPRQGRMGAWVAIDRLWGTGEPAMLFKRLSDVTVTDLFTLAYAKSLCRGAVLLGMFLVAVIVVEIVVGSVLQTRVEELQKQVTAKSATRPTMEVVDQRGSVR